MTSTEVARRDVNAIPDRYEWEHIEKVTAAFAKSSMCPKAFKEKPDDLMVVALSLRDTNVPFTLNTLNQCYVIDGRMEMMAQLKVALAARHGWDLWFEPGECDTTHAIVHYKAPGRPERTMEYTIDEARAGHLLDEWVEQWVSTGEKWPDGKPKNRKVKVTVSVDGEALPEADMPDWARQAKTTGPPQRKEPWFANREAMLMARAVTKALRYGAPHLTLGVGDADFDPVTTEVDESPPKPEVTTEPVNRPDRSVAPDGSTIPEHLREPALDPETRDRLIAALEGLPADQAGQVRDAARDLGIPNLRSARATRAHGALVGRLIAEAQNPPAPAQAPGGEAKAESVGAGTSAPQEREIDVVTGEIVDGVPGQGQMDYAPDEEPFE